MLLIITQNLPFTPTGKAFSAHSHRFTPIHTGIEHKKGYKTKRVLKKNLSTLMRFKMGLNQRPPD